MLNLILGRNGSGKTEYVRNLVADGVKNGNNGYIIIVPEQFSYETERDMLSKLGAKNMLSIDVYSLSRLADVILDKYGKTSNKQPVDDGVRMISISLAVEGLGEEAQVFGKYASRPKLISELVSFANEIRQCDVMTDELKNVADTMSDSTLKMKLSELSMIVSLYNSIISQEFYDNNDSLNILYDVLCENDFFNEKTVVVDSFYRFTKQELKVIGKIIAQCKNIFITFCTDSEKAYYDEFSPFHNIALQVNSIKQLARENNISISKPVILEPIEKQKTEMLNTLEKYIFRNEDSKVLCDTDESITICSAPDVSQECEFVASSIKRLMRESDYRCKDIIVLERKKDTYDNELRAAFRKYGVPFFEDKRQPVEAQPLVVFIKTLLEIALYGLSTETLIRHLKTGLSSLSDDEISELENYALVWKIRASDWGTDFSENPRGFGYELSDFDVKELDKLNKYRKMAVAPVLKFRKEFREAEKGGKTRALYDYLVSNKTAYRLKSLALKLSDDGKTALYEEQNSVWSLVIAILDKVYLATNDFTVSPERWCELFNVLLSVSDLGTLPQGLDDVTVAAADRVRTSMKKAVFIVGANDGVFPLNPSTRGLLNDGERIKLKSLGVELAETAEYKLVEEKFTAYKALTTATEKLFVSYSAANYSGESMESSSIVTGINELFSDVKTISIENIDLLDKIESDASAFEAYAETFRYNNEMNSTLGTYFKDNKQYSGRVRALNNAVNKTEKCIEDKELAKELFGRNMFVSASKTEDYYLCPFKYFCKYGINATPRREADLDSAVNGVVIHHVFETILHENSKQELLGMSDNELKTKIDKVLMWYISNKMGGTEGKTTRFLRHYNAFGDRTFSILKRMIEEFRVSEFTPVDFELPISKDSEIKPYALELPDGCSLEIFGSVDRVDVMEKDGRKYLRVVDYKSKGKTFRLTDAIEGINTQMLIYLFAISANGKQKYGDIIPSGVFYMSAKPETADLGRNATADEINSKRTLHNKMSGILLDDMDAIIGMESDGNGVFIPVKIDKDGNAKGSLISSDNLKLLNKKIDSILKNMVSSLQDGRIPVLPVGKKSCEYCDYKAVCLFEEGDCVREIPKLKDDEVIKALNEEVQGDE